MASQAYQLIMEKGPSPGKVFVLSEQEETIIGRDIDNDIVIADAEVSRKHARLLFQQTKFILEDLGSTNGSFVNERRIGEPTVLNPGDAIQFGENVKLIYEVAQFDPDATMPTPKEDVSGAPSPGSPPPVGEPSPAQQPWDQPEAIPYRPATPAPESPEALPTEEDSKRTLWIIGGCGSIFLFVCVVLPGLVLWYIDSQNLWCDLFPGILESLGFFCP